MRISVLIDLIKLTIVFGGTWALFTFIPFSFDPPEMQLSIEKEEKLGDLIVDEMVLKDKNTIVISNPGLDSAMNIISKILTSKIGNTDYEYKIKVIENETINAFTLPGGNIFIYSGLIEFSDHPEELAAVLAHEIGHVEKRHVVNKLIKELGLTLLFSVLAGGDNILTQEIGRTAMSSVFDRKQEEEADLFALELLEKARINPKVMAIFFRRMNDKLGNYNENLEILASHPNNNSRIKSALEYQTKDNFKSQKLNLNWEFVKKSLKSK
ncbi:MAG: M48 family metallopeptidase [Bacteroidetes bacterium]|nr:M48 family metallopeptidase [Bacteroidota bacterium]HET6244506.1 M48 family metallopeptidase [Bacteroidia bacterium]